MVNTDETTCCSFPAAAAVRKAWGIDTLKPLDGGQAMAFVGGDGPEARYSYAPCKGRAQGVIGDR